MWNGHRKHSVHSGSVYYQLALRDSCVTLRVTLPSVLLRAVTASYAYESFQQRWLCGPSRDALGTSECLSPVACATQRVAPLTLQNLLLLLSSSASFVGEPPWPGPWRGSSALHTSEAGDRLCHQQAISSFFRRPPRQLLHHWETVQVSHLALCHGNPPHQECPTVEVSNYNT